MSVGHGLLASSLKVGVALMAVVAVGTTTSCVSRNEAIVFRTCADGTVTPLEEVPETAWPASLTEGQGAIAQLWSTPFSARLRRPDSEAQLRIEIRIPANADLSFFSPPADLATGRPYMCDSVVAGTGGVTIDGFAASAGPVPIKDAVLDIRIKTMDSFALVDSATRKLPVPGTKDTLIVELGIDFGHMRYGKTYLSHPTSQTSGIDTMCVMTDFQ